MPATCFSGGVVDRRTTDSAASAAAISIFSGLSMAAGEEWIFEAVLFLQNNNTTSGVNLVANFPTGTVGQGSVDGAVTANTDNEVPLVWASGTTATAAGGWCKLSGVQTRMDVALRVVCGATPGNLDLQMKSASTNLAIAKAGSFVRAYRIGP